MNNANFVYVLRSTVDHSKHYTGHCNNLDKRLSGHNQGKTRSNKAFAPWIIIYFEEFDSLANAVNREKYFKSGSGREYLKSLNL